MTVTVASGKGGTGKTTFAVNLAYVLAKKGTAVRLLDCDVEEPNDHLFVKPLFTESSAVTVTKPVWDPAKCRGCGMCAQACNYNAIAVVREQVLLFGEVCNSCGVCSFVCPNSALREEEVSIGVVEAAPNNEPFYFAHGKLHIGESRAPTVISAVKTHIADDEINIIDAPPGTACPVIKALDGADVAVLVTEPTPFGLNDLQLAVGVTLKMGIPTGIVINRSDGTDALIRDYAESVGVPILGRIPFMRAYAETYSSGGIIAEVHPEIVENLVGIYAGIRAIRGGRVPVAPETIQIPAHPVQEQTITSGGTAAKELAIISGKGGTGKTTVAAAFAVLAKNKVMTDTDVDAADLHLLLSPEVSESHPFVGGAKPVIDSRVCTACGICAKACHFDAFVFDGPANDVVDRTWRVDPLACEGCGLCALSCPVDAIEMVQVITGNWFVSQTPFGQLVDARLGIAEENSGRLATQVRNRGAELAAIDEIEVIIGDGPPGTGCPVIASISGVDLVLIVTEPTVSGVHDLVRVLDLADHFGVPALILINKADLNSEQAARIETIAQQRHSRVIAHVAFDAAVNDALMAGKSVIEWDENDAAGSIVDAWVEVSAALNHRKPIAEQGGESEDSRNLSWQNA